MTTTVHSASGPSSRSGSLTGLGALVRFTLRRDRGRLTTWIVATAVVIGVSAWNLRNVYGTQQAVEAYVRLFGNNPALVAFAGPGFGFDRPSIGVILVNETQLWGMITLAILSIFLVNRHTRAEEDTERIELVLSQVVGRHAPTGASMVVVAATEVLIGVTAAVTFILAGYPVLGSISLAGSMLAVGLVFISVTAAAAQFFSTGRATTGASLMVLLVAFILRAVGDIGHNRLTWLSPIGWAQSVRSFADERWWPLAVCAVVGAALVGGAFWLADHRDLGSGFIGNRPGRARAARSLTDPFGFALRLQRGLIGIWVIGLFTTGYVFGIIADDVDAMARDNPQFAEVFAQMGRGSITDSYLATAMAMLGLMAGGFGIAAMLASSNEERSGHLELMLSRRVGRLRWIGSHLAIATLGTVVLMIASGLGVGVAYARVTGDVGQIPRLVRAALVTVPAAFVFIGLVVVVFGFLPRAIMLSWVPLSVTAIVVFFGELLELPNWMRHLSPFEFLPAVPAEPLQAWPLVWLSLIGALGVIAGMIGFHRRGIAVT